MDIKLRPWYSSDMESLKHVMNDCDRSYLDESITILDQYDVGDEAISPMLQFAGMPYDGDGYARAIEVDGEVAGHVQVARRSYIYDFNCDFFITLLPKYCGKGIGTWVLKEMIGLAFGGPLDCFKDNHNNKKQLYYDGLYATFYESNLTAKGMCEKAGLWYVGDAPECVGLLHGEPCRKLIYCIQRPRPEVPEQGVCLMAWERRDIDRLALLFETAEGRYDDIVHPHMYGCVTATCNMGEDEGLRRWETLTRMREYVDNWKEIEDCGDGIYRAIVNDGSIVGLITLNPQEGKRSIDAEMGCILMSEHCGKGIATQAVRLMLEEGFWMWPKLHRVTAWVYAPNKAASRVLEKNGFQVEGIQRESVMCEGRPTDRIAYGLLKKEYAL